MPGIGSSPDKTLQMIGRRYKVDPDFGRGVAEGLCIETNKAAAE